MKPVLLFGAVLSLSLRPALAVELKPATVSAFDHYIANLEAGWAPRNHGEKMIQVADTQERTRKLQTGEVIVRPSRGNNGETDIPGGMISDWIGGFFLPNAKLNPVLTVLQDYGHHKITFAPDIVDSVVRSHKTPDEYEVYLRIVKSKYLVTDVLNSDHLVRWTHPSPTQAICRSYSTRIAEVADAGKPNEHELPVGNDRGMVWRMYGYWFLEERDGGVYVEYETITLSRDIPYLMSKMLGPILHSVPPEALHSSLEKCRRALSSTIHNGTLHAGD